MIKGKAIFSTLMIGCFITFVSCGGGSNIDEGIDNETSIDTLVDETSIDMFESPDVDYHLPSALQVASILRTNAETLIIVFKIINS